MALAKIQIVKRVQVRLRDHGAYVSEYDDELLTVLSDICTRGDFINDTQTTDTTADIVSVTLPDDTRHVKQVSIDTFHPLVKIDFKTWRHDSVQTTSTGRPHYWAVRGDTLYLLPTPNDTYTLNIDRSKHHGTDLTAIELDFIFLSVVSAGVIKELYLGQLRKSFDLKGGYAARWDDLYERELRKRLDELEPDPLVVGYFDV